MKKIMFIMLIFNILMCDSIAVFADSNNIQNTSGNEIVNIDRGSISEDEIDIQAVAVSEDNVEALAMEQNEYLSVLQSSGNNTQVAIPIDARVYNGHSYYVYGAVDQTVEGRSWEDAKEWCESNGGYLAVIESDAENDAVYNIMKDFGYSAAYFGLYNEASKSNQWKWTKGNSSYRNWGDTYNVSSGKDYYAQFDPVLGSKWKCNSKYGYEETNRKEPSTYGRVAFICEWDVVKQNKITYETGVLKEYKINTDDKGNTTMTLKIDDKLYGYNDLYYDAGWNQEYGTLETWPFMYTSDNVSNIIERYNDKKCSNRVIYQMIDGKISYIASVSDVIIPEYSLIASPDSFTYQNSSFNQQSISFKVIAKCKYNSSSNSTYIKKGFPYNKIMDIEGLYLDIQEIKLEVPSKNLYFKKGAFNSEKTTITANGKVGLNKSFELDQEIFVSDGYIPSEIKNDISVDCAVTYDGKEESESKTLYIKVANIDLQSKKANSNKTKRSNTDELKKLKQKLNSRTYINLSAGLLKDYFSVKEVEQIQKSIELQLIWYLNMDKLREKTFWEKVQERVGNIPEKFKGKVRKEILKKLGLSETMITKPKKLDMVMYFDNSEGDVFEFRVDGSIYSGNNGKNDIGGLAQVLVKPCNTGKKEKAEQVGIVDYVDFGGFADLEISYLSLAYNLAWGNDAKKVAEMLVDKPFTDLAVRVPGKLYEFSVDNVKKSVKKTTISCPVNVIVYDMEGNTVGKIVNDEVDPDYDDVYMTVNGEDKIVYLTNDDYKIELVGNAEGKMDYKVEELLDGNVVRTISTNNIPLSESTEYNGIVPESNTLDSCVYSLISNSGEEIPVEKSSDILFTEKKNLISYRIINNNNRTILEIDGIGETENKKVCWKTNIPENLRDEITDIYCLGNNTIRSLRFDGLSCLENVYISGVDGFIDFSNCERLDNIVLPENLTQDPDLSDCVLLDRVDLPDSISEISSGHFSNCKNLNTINIPSNVKKIGYATFSDCLSLTHIDLPEGIEKIGDGAFSNCVSLEEIIIPKSLDEIGERAFEGCSSLHNIEMADTEDNINRVGYCAFKDCTSLEKLLFPKINDMRGSLFKGCTALKDIKFANEVTEIPDACFESCYGLEQLVIPEGIKKVGHSFGDCVNLSQITMPVNISLDYPSFWGCDVSLRLIGSAEKTSYGFIGGFRNPNITEGPKSDLTSVFIDADVKEISGESFYSIYGDSRIKSVSMSNSITKIGVGAFEGSTCLEEVNLGAGVKEIDAYAFANCGKLKTIVIPNSVNRIGNSAFCGCGLEKIYIGTGITNIEDIAFSHCDSLKYVYYGGTESDWATITIENDNDPLLNAQIIFNYKIEEEGKSEENKKEDGSNKNNEEQNNKDIVIEEKAVIETHFKGSTEVKSVLLDVYKKNNPDALVRKTKFKSSDKKIVKVNNKGKVKGGKKSGTATITMFVKTLETVTKPNGKQKKKLSKWTPAGELTVNNTGK